MWGKNIQIGNLQHQDFGMRSVKPPLQILKETPKSQEALVVLVDERPGNMTLTRGHIEIPTEPLEHV
jgi:hypothetical protein